MEQAELQVILGNHGKWIRGEVDGVRANLDGANLYGANLDGANLTRANLYGANLYRANLTRANLDGANLTRANLYGANLKNAKVDDAANITGEPWKEYIEKVVPALLTAGGKTIDEIAASGAWECHSWENCPMAIAFGVKGPSETPMLLRPRVEQFVQLFDAGLIPCPGQAVAVSAASEAESQS